jgi:pimeloyl-ACP methyl ester carboxylesterase
MSTQQATKGTRKSKASGCLKWIGVAGLALIAASIGTAGFWTNRTNQQANASEVFDFTADAPGRFADVGGRQIHYIERGDVTADPQGAPILFLHGFNQGAGIEASLLADEFGPSRAWIIPDLLGFGFSERVTQPTPDYTVRGQTRLMRDLLDELGVQQADVMGVSYGGAVAAQFALDYPERVRNLVLIGPQLFDSGGGIFSSLGNVPFGIGRALTWDALGAGPRGTLLYRLGCQANGYCPSDERVAARQRRAEIKGTTDAMVAINAAPQDSRLPQDLGQISAPTLLVYGDRDAYYSREVAEKAQAAIPGAQLQFVPDADHTPQMHRPGPTAQIISEFLNR